MQGLDPQKIETKDVFSWFLQSLQLINRNLLHYLGAIALFFVSMVGISQAIQLFQYSVPALALLLTLVFVGAFLFYFLIAALVMISYCADHSENITVRLVMQQFVSSQRAFLTMTILTLMLGTFYWYLSVLMNPGSDIISMSQSTIALLSDKNELVFYVFKTAAVFLYFLLLVMFFLRTFFSVPLIIFHGLSYHEAKALSQKGILKNIRPMSYVMMTWFVLFSIATIMIPMLAMVLMPLFATFGYVAYRHIYLGRGANKVAITRAVMTTA